MGVVRVGVQGVQKLKANELVKAVYVHIAPASMEAWAQQQSARQAAHLQQLLTFKHLRAPLLVMECCYLPKPFLVLSSKLSCQTVTAQAEAP